MREINRIPKRWINQPNGVPQLNADGDLEGPIILRDIKDPATGGGPEDVPAANEIVVVRNNLAVGKNGTTWTPYAPLEVAMDAVAFQNRTTNGISFTAEYVGEPVTVMAITNAMGQVKVVWPDRTVTTHGFGTEAMWSGETAGGLPIELVPVNDTIREVIFGGYYVNDLKCSHLPDLFSLSIAKSKMRVLDLRGCAGMKQLWLLDMSPGGSKGDVRTILLDPAIVWESVVLDLDDYGDVDISDWRWEVGGYGAQNLLRGRTICGHLNLAGWTSESYFFEVGQTRISEVTLPASVAGFVINNSELQKINGGEDLQMIYGEGSSLDLSGNQLSAEELDAFFERLPAQTAPGCNLWVMDNPGSETCNRLIAQAKGFIVNVI
jgi:hypothetical protein